MKFLLALVAFTASGASATSGAGTAASSLHKREPNGSYVPGTAPRDNIFTGITLNEEDEIRDFLGRQGNATLYVCCRHRPVKE